MKLTFAFSPDETVLRKELRLQYGPKPHTNFMILLHEIKIMNEAYLDSYVEERVSTTTYIIRHNRPPPNTIAGTSGDYNQGKFLIAV